MYCFQVTLFCCIGAVLIDTYLSVLKEYMHSWHFCWSLEVYSVHERLLIFILLSLLTDLVLLQAG